MAQITNMITEILKRISSGTDRHDRAEAKELLRRLNQSASETPRFATPQTKTPRKKETRK